MTNVKFWAICRNLENEYNHIPVNYEANELIIQCENTRDKITDVIPSKIRETMLNTVISNYLEKSISEGYKLEYFESYPELEHETYCEL